jgi:transposase
VAALPPLPSKKPDFSVLRSELERLGVGDDAYRLILGLLESMAEQNLQLSFRLDAALRQLWRRKSEKISSDQLLLFLAKLPSAESAKADVESLDSGALPSSPEQTPPTPPKPKAKPRGKQPFPEHLPRRSEIISVPPDERRCSCGADKTCIGYDKQVLWDFEPASFFLHERLLEKLACKKCEEKGVTSAPAPGKPIEGGRPGPGLLAQIITAKDQDSLPLYRQSKIYKRNAIHLAPSTLGDWYAQGADLWQPVYRFLRTDTLVHSYLLSLDDTGLPVLDREDPRGIKKGHIWTYIGDQNRIAFCEYTPTWSGDAPQRVLAEFRGRVIQGDGYAGIDGAFAGPAPPNRAGCMDHSPGNDVILRRTGISVGDGDARAGITIGL